MYMCTNTHIHICMYVCRQTNTVISKKEITNSGIMFLKLEVRVKAKIVKYRFADKEKIRHLYIKPLKMWALKRYWERKNDNCKKELKISINRQ